MHGAIGLDGEEIGDLDRADLRHAAEIVAQQIDDHQILGALLLVHGEPGLQPRVLARGAPARRRPLHRPRRDALALAAEEELRRHGEDGEIFRADQRAMRHALLAPQRGVERDRIALEGEAVFQREVDLIDVARGDIVLHSVEGVAVALARPGEPQVGDLRPLGGAVRLEPGTRARVVERQRRAEQPDPKQRHVALIREQHVELRLEAMAELVGEEARGMEPERELRLDSVERRLDLTTRIGAHDTLRLRIEQAPAARGQTVVEEDVGERGHVLAQSRSSIAHMGDRGVKIEAWPQAMISISPLPSAAMSPISRRARPRSRTGWPAAPSQRSSKRR